MKMKNKPKTVKPAKFEDIGFAKIDHHRIFRKGFPEVIYCEGKTPNQIADIASRIYNRGHDVLATRADKKAFEAVKKVLPKAKYHKTARIIINKQPNIPTSQQANSLTSRHPNKPFICIITAGTSDIPVAEEAAVTCDYFGIKTERLFDVGVAGVHRLLKNIKQINKSSVVIVVAGMEGALPSVIGGLIDKPIIAVPTSVGYGASFKGLSALLTMLNSCAPGVAVVNIDNGFGAAVMARAIINCK